MFVHFFKIKGNILGWFFLLNAIGFLFSPLVSLAQGSASQPAGGVGNEINTQLNKAGAKTTLTARDPRETVARIIRLFLTLIGAIFLAFVVYAGYLWLTAGGDERKIDDAKSYLKNGVVGLIIILVAYGITLLVSVYLIRATGDQFYKLPGPGMPEYPIQYYY